MMKFLIEFNKGKRITENGLDTKKRANNNYKYAGY